MNSWVHQRKGGRYRSAGMEQRQEGVGPESAAAGCQCYANMTFTSDGPVLPQRMQVKCCQKLLFRCPILHNAKLRSLRRSRLRRIVQKNLVISLIISQVPFFHFSLLQLST